MNSTILSFLLWFPYRQHATRIMLIIKRRKTNNANEKSNQSFADACSGIWYFCWNDTICKRCRGGATLSVDLDPAVNTGKIIHGAAGFLYGVSSEDVPTTNTIVPLKSKILCTKGAVGTEHPYGDALDVAKTFLESGGQQVMMYNSNYYGVFGVTATIDQYCNDLKNYICPAVAAWKKAWKQEHGTPDHQNDNFGKIDIDQAIVYIPINEGTPAGGNFYEAWEKYYKAIKDADLNATLAGPNSCAYGAQFSNGQSMEG